MVRITYDMREILRRSIDVCTTIMFSFSFIHFFYIELGDFDGSS